MAAFQTKHLWNIHVVCDNQEKLEWLPKSVSSTYRQMPDKVIPTCMCAMLFRQHKNCCLDTGITSLTSGPKGHITCTWVQCATFSTDQPGWPFLFTDWPKKRKLGRGCWDLASCQHALKSNNLSQWETGVAILFFQSAWKTQTNKRMLRSCFHLTFIEFHSVVSEEK